MKAKMWFLALGVTACWALAARAANHPKQRGPEVVIIPRGGTSVHARLVAVRGDSLEIAFFPDSVGERRTVPTSAVQQVTLVRHASATRPLIISAAAGVTGALLGLASGDDPPGWFSMTAETKATLLGATFFVSTLAVSGLVQAVRAADVEIPLASLPLTERQRTLQQVLNGTYVTPHPLEFALAVGYLNFSDSPDNIVGGVRISYRCKPRVSFDISYVRSPWSKWRTEVNLRSENSSLTRTLRSRHIYWSLEVRAHLAAREGVVPYVATGFLLGRTYRNETTHSVYRDPETGIQEEYHWTWQEKSNAGGIPLVVGLTVPLHRLVRLDLRAEQLLTDDTPQLLQVGLEIGRRR